MQFSKQKWELMTKEARMVLTFQRAVQWSAAVLNVVVFVCLIYLALGIKRGLFEGRHEAIVMILVGGAILMALSLVHFIFERILSRRWLQAREKSSMDLLTGGLNRPCFEEIAEEEMRRCGRYHVPLTLCFIDLDDFRSYNESFGRSKGDDLLQKFSDALRGAVRFTDTVARYEADEFCILLPHTDLVRGEKFVIRVLGIIRDQIDAGFCAGLTSFKPGENKTHFMMRARMALQHAKSEGKQRVRCIIGDDNSQTIVHF